MVLRLKNFRRCLPFSARALAAIALGVGGSFTGPGGLINAQAQTPGAAPFPISTSLAGKAQADIFSYALESGFVRISFIDIKPANTGKKPRNSRDTAAKAEDKQIYGLIALDLKPGWKTYWRNPGTSGFAPKIALDGGARAEILFPPPQLFRGQRGEWNYGYKNRVILPFRLSLPQPARQAVYSGTLSIGICETLCMPQKLPFRYNVAITHQEKDKADGTAALQALPKMADKNFQLISAKAVAGGVQLTLLYPQSREASPPQLFLDGGDMQLGLPSSLAGPDKDRPGKAPQGKKALQIYQAPLLLGEAEAGAPIAYSAVLPNGKAVSGSVQVSAPAAPKP